MKIILRISAYFAFLSILVFPHLSWAIDFDSSKLLLCTVIDTTECIMGENCNKVMAEEINLPRFLQINIDKKVIVGKTAGQNPRTSPIERIEVVDQKLILQGAEQDRKEEQDGFGWTIAIMEASGNMVLTASGDDIGVIAFGVCMPD